jgi:hypothetical protein
VSPPAEEEETAAPAEAVAEEPAQQAAAEAVAEEPAQQAAAEDDDFSPSTDYDGAEDAHMVAEEEVEAEQEAAAAPVRESVMVKTLHECPFTAPFDKNGAIWWIGTDGGSKEYENPQLTGELYLEISTLYVFVFCYTTILPSFLVCGVSVSLLPIHCPLFAFSDTT